ncbi:MAG: hypothetical protein HN576_13140 [Bacteriovoracaceae bacterium]|jgi:hypothetical protein|nr:hypothetical protein [Bacteriovoracaceae bacterium]
MKKIAEEFFSHQKVWLSNEDSFEQTDLYLYLKLMYGEAPVFLDSGFIKVKKDNKGMTLFEHIYYDHCPEENELYITIPSLNLLGTKIENSSLGEKLSKKGYISVSPSEELKSKALSFFNKLPFNPTNIKEGRCEPFATLKLSESIWKEDRPSTSKETLQVKDQIQSFLEKKISYSQVLASLNIFDLNFLEWQESRFMKAHNGVDYKSFINLITYNTDHCNSPRSISVGAYHWYDETFNGLFTNNWEALMNIEDKKREMDSFKVDTNFALLINVFNPRFYHQVGEMQGDGSLYVCTANKSFKEITNRFEFNW